MVVVIGLLTTLVAAMLITGHDPGESANPTEQPSLSETRGPDDQQQPAASGDPTNQPDSEAPAAPTGDTGAPHEGNTATIDPEVVPPGTGYNPVINVKKPEFTNYTENLTRVREHYAERHVYNTITVAWRPGAFPPEEAARVADTAARLLGEANARIGTNFYPELEIFLADQLYAPECMGCQGFAAADLFQIFILHDGSVADDEFEALLLHEIVHVIAAHEISLPFSLFFAEGLATWAMSDHLVASGYLSPLQTAVWAWEAGAMPSLQELRDDDFAGRVRKRVYYDGAASFAFFMVETYGWDAYRQLYTLDPPEMVIDRTWEQLDAEWQAYLSRYAGQTINGTDAHLWWAAMTRVIDGFGVLYNDPEPVTAEQYRALVLSRLAVNRAEIQVALDAIEASNLLSRTAH
jgi:hypothetical protein